MTSIKRRVSPVLSSIIRITWNVSEFLLGLLSGYVAIYFSPAYIEVVVRDMVGSSGPLPFHPLWGSMAFLSVLVVPLVGGFMLGGTFAKVSCKTKQLDLARKTGIGWVVAFMSVMTSMFPGTESWFALTAWQAFHLVSVLAYGYLGSFTIRVMELPEDI